MQIDELCEKLEHDLLANVRNFEVVTDLLSSESTDIPAAASLLRASIEQLDAIRHFVQELGVKKVLESNPSTAAQS